MRNALAVVGLLAAMPCFAEPLVTIACEAPKGQTQNYGVAMAPTQTKPNTPNHLSVAIPDGFNARPTFVVDSSRKKLTLLWSDPKETAREVPVIAYSPLVITAMDAHPGKNGAVLLYSFYPQLGVMFVAQHYLDINAADAVQSAFVAKCEFRWSGTP